MHGSRKYCQSKSNFDKVFFFFSFSLVDEGRDDPNTTISGPASAFRWPNIESGLAVFLFSGDPDQYCYETL